MSRDDDLAARLLRELGNAPVPPSSTAEEALRVERVTATIDETLGRLQAARVKQRIQRRVIAGAGAVAAAAVVALVAFWRSGAEVPKEVAVPTLRSAVGTVFVQRDGGAREPAQSGTVLGPHDELSTAAETHAELLLTDRAVVEVGPGSVLHVSEMANGDEGVDLVRGRVALRVPKLAAGHRLTVNTRDATVSVRGTSFSVSVSPTGNELVTRVEVSDGRVEVAYRDQLVLVAAGQSWSTPPASTVPFSVPLPAVPEPAPTDSGPEPSAANAELRPTNANVPGTAAKSARATSTGRAASRRATQPADSEQAVRTLEGAAPASAEPPPAPPPVPKANSTLAEENRLYQQAMRRAHSGDAGRALSDFEGLIAGHPRSPLLESARVERFRLLLQLGRREQAALAARRYLSDYPNGFARAEAKQIALYGLAESQ